MVEIRHRRLKDALNSLPNVILDDKSINGPIVQLQFR